MGSGIKTIKRPRVYISGPMRGYPELNRYEFFWAENKLENAGYAVINPIKLTSMLKPTDTSDDEYLAVDLYLLDMCDVIYMLKGWENSEGAKLEYNRAKELGISITYQETEHGAGE